MIEPVWKVEADEGSQHMCQHPAPARLTVRRDRAVGGISLANFDDDLGVAVARFPSNRREAYPVPQPSFFTGPRCFTRLGQEDGQMLSVWLQQAQGIDAAIDLSVRAWKITGDPVIIGIFENHQPSASWLIVQCPAGWVLANCANGSVSDVSAALSDVLTLIGDAPKA